MRILLITILIVIDIDGFAQCADCPVIKEFKSDYCYSDTLFEGYCAQFAVQNTAFYLQREKKSSKVPIVDTDRMEALVALSVQQSLKLSGTDLLFVIRALRDWKKAERDIGMIHYENGLGIKILQEGSGEVPEAGKIVEVHYTGYLEDGKKFDSSVDRGTPFTFPLGQGRVIKGWDESVGQLKVGTKALVKIPPELGYGARGAGGVIPPNATLYFEIELLGIQ